MSSCTVIGRVWLIPGFKKIHERNGQFINIEKKKCYESGFVC